jgi:ribosomal protein S18 acetylase RimI-like enzyme
VGALLPPSREPQLTIRTLDAIHLENARGPLLKFIAQHAGGRITRRARKWLRTVARADLRHAGTCIVTASLGKQLKGVLLVAKHGEQVMAIVVHRSARRKKLGQTLIRHALRHMRFVEARVATDNAASIGMCFAAGMVAIALERGVTGKPTLLFVAGERGGSH